MSEWKRTSPGFFGRKVNRFILYAEDCESFNNHRWSLSFTGQYTTLVAGGAKTFEEAKKAAEAALRKLCQEALKGL